MISMAFICCSKSCLFVLCIKIWSNSVLSTLVDRSCKKSSSSRSLVYSTFASFAFYGDYSRMLCLRSLSDGTYRLSLLCNFATGEKSLADLSVYEQLSERSCKSTTTLYLFLRPKPSDFRFGWFIIARFTESVMSFLMFTLSNPITSLIVRSSYSVSFILFS